MRRFQTLAVASLFMAVLAATIFLPPIVSQIKDKMLLGQVKTQLVDDKLIADATSITLVDKIKLIVSYSQHDSNIAMLSQEKQLNEQDLPLIAVNELQKLQKSGAFPNIDLNSDYKCNCELLIFTDIDKPDKNVRVWVMDYTFEKYGVYLMLDADTHLIYEYNVRSNGVSLPAVDAEASSQKFAEYMGLKWDSKSYIQDGTEQYSAVNGAVFYQFSALQEWDGLNMVGMQIVR